jgi:hypothetical protein
MWVIAKGGDLNMIFFCGIQNAGARLTADDLSIDSKIDLFQIFTFWISYDLYNLVSLM